LRPGGPAGAPPARFLSRRPAGQLQGRRLHRGHRTVQGRADRGGEAAGQVPVEVSGLRSRKDLLVGSAGRQELAMYFWPGVAAIWGALLLGLASITFYSRADRGRTDLLALARSTYAGFATCVVAASAVLMTLIVQHRFDVSYVNSYSSRDLPFHFLISSFWGGQEGSFLLWCFFGALIGLVVWRTAKEMEAPVMIVYTATFVAIIAILCKQSPFKILP